jgi:OOP family OmpA-OmpF porin
VYAKAGIHRWNLDTSLPALTGTADDNNTDPTYGVGAQYRFNDRFSMRTGYDRFEVGDLDVDLVQVQGIYRF